MRVVLGALLLLLAPSAAAHFHDGLAVGRHELAFRLDSGTVLAEERFEVRNVENRSFDGKVYAWLPPGGNATLFLVDGLPPQAGGGGLASYDLAASNASLAPNETRNVTLHWRITVAPGDSFARRIVYSTDLLHAEATPPLQVLRVPPAGLAALGGEVVVQRAEESAVQGWHVLAVLVAALLAGAWWWDRRRHRP